MLSIASNVVLNRFVLIDGVDYAGETSIGGRPKSGRKQIVFRE